MTLARALRQGTIQEQGEALMKRYAPGVKLDARLLGGRRMGAWYSPSDNEIKWPLADGLVILLHELGHYRLKHDHDNPGIPMVAKGLMLWEEVTAWLWAEQTAKKLGVEFDYEYAEQCFNRKKWHRRRPLVKINWRYKNGTGIP